VAVKHQSIIHNVAGNRIGGLGARFEQNSDLKENLVDTGKCQLKEAHMYTGYWWIGHDTVRSTH